MKTKVLDKVTVTFYEDTQMDKDLNEMLHTYCQRRFRTVKLKEWAYAYLREHHKNELNEVNNPKIVPIKNIDNEPDEGALMKKL